MTQEGEKREITLEEAAEALDIVTALLDQLSIPATRAQEFALLNATLADLKGFVASKIAELNRAQSEQEVAISEPEASSPL